MFGLSLGSFLILPLSLSISFSSLVPFGWGGRAASHRLMQLLYALLCLLLAAFLRGAHGARTRSKPFTPPSRDSWSTATSSTWGYHTGLMDVPATSLVVLGAKRQRLPACLAVPRRRSLCKKPSREARKKNSPVVPPQRREHCSGGVLLPPAFGVEGHLRSAVAMTKATARDICAELGNQDTIAVLRRTKQTRLASAVWPRCCSLSFLISHVSSSSASSSCRASLLTSRLALKWCACRSSSVFRSVVPLCAFLLAFPKSGWCVDSTVRNDPRGKGCGFFSFKQTARGRSSRRLDSVISSVSRQNGDSSLNGEVLRKRKYSDTVLLPRTKFKLKGDNLRTEEAIQALWRRHGTYERILNRLFIQQHMGTCGRRSPAPVEGHKPTRRIERQRKCTCGLCSTLLFEDSHQWSPLLPPQSKTRGTCGPSSSIEGEIRGSPPEPRAPEECMQLAAEGFSSSQSSFGTAWLPSLSPPPRASFLTSALDSSSSDPGSRPSPRLRREFTSSRIPVYMLLDGPPYANGETHMGHAINKCLKDFVTRFYLLRRRCVHMIPGWDGHGLPIELKALQKMEASQRSSARVPQHDGSGSAPAGQQRFLEDSKWGRRDTPLDALRLREEARKVAMHYTELQKKDFQRFGVWAHWHRAYLTLSSEYQRDELELFWRMWQKRLVYEGFRPVYWSPSSGTALADSELDYKPRVSRGLYCAFRLSDPSRLTGSTNASDISSRSTAVPFSGAGTRRPTGDSSGHGARGAELPRGCQFPVSVSNCASALQSFPSNRSASTQSPCSCPASTAAATHDFDFRRLLASSTRVSLIVWTTMPYTLPANEAVAVNPRARYVILEAVSDPAPSGDPLCGGFPRQTMRSLCTLLGRRREGEAKTSVRSVECSAGPCDNHSRGLPRLSSPSEWPHYLAPASREAPSSDVGGSRGSSGEKDSGAPFSGGRCRGEGPGGEDARRDTGEGRAEVVVPSGLTVGSRERPSTTSHSECCHQKQESIELWIVAEEAVARVAEAVGSPVLPAEIEPGQNQTQKPATELRSFRRGGELQSSRQPEVATDRASEGTVAGSCHLGRPQEGDRVPGNERAGPSRRTRLVIRGSVEGSQLIGLRYQHPLLAGREGTVIASESLVVSGKGSGLVHIAPGHGFEDFVLMEETYLRNKTEGACRDPSSSSLRPVSAHSDEEKRREGKSAERNSATRCSLEDFVMTETFLSASGAADVGVSHKENQAEAQDWHFAVRSPVDGQGRFTADVQDEGLVGLDVLGAGEAAVVERLKRRNALVAEVPFLHQYPHDWRTKQPVICRATSQFFLRIDCLKASVLRTARSIHWLPYPSLDVADQQAVDSIEHEESLFAVRPEEGQSLCVSSCPSPASFLARGAVQPVSSAAHSRVVAAVSRRKGNWCLSRQRQWGVPFPFFVWRRESQPLGDPRLPRDRQHVTREMTWREGNQPAGERSSHSGRKTADVAATQDRYETSAQGPTSEEATSSSRGDLPLNEVNPRLRLLGDDKTFSHISKLVLEEGSDAWWKLEVKDLLPEIYRSSAASLRPLRSTFDVWFDAGCAWLAGRRFLSRWMSQKAQGSARHECDERLTNPCDCTENSGPQWSRLTFGNENRRHARPEVPEGVASSQRYFPQQRGHTVGSERGHPVDVRTIVVEGSDQHRGWFQALLFTHAATQAVVLEGQGRRESGRPLSGEVKANETLHAETRRDSASVEEFRLRRQQEQEGKVAIEETGSLLQTEGRERRLTACRPQAHIRGISCRTPAHRRGCAALASVANPGNEEYPWRRRGNDDVPAAISLDGWSCPLGAADASRDKPFDIAVTHGFVLDPRGRKMSKSEGNVFSPRLFFPSRGGRQADREFARQGGSRRPFDSKQTEALTQQQTNRCSEEGSETQRAHSVSGCEQATLDSKTREPLCNPQLSLTFFGADVLRLFVASVNYSRDILIPASAGSNVKTTDGSPRQRGKDRGARPDTMNALDQAAASYGKIRNTIKFLLGNLYDFNPPEDALSCQDLPFFDRSMLRQLQRTLGRTTYAYELFDFSRALREVLSFLADPLSSFYFEVAKDRLYVSSPDGVRRRSCQTVLAVVLLTLLKLLGPITPHLAEEAFLRLPSQIRTHLRFATGRPGSHVKEGPPERDKAASATEGELQFTETALPVRFGEEQTPAKPDCPIPGRHFTSLFESGWPRLVLDRSSGQSMDESQLSSRANSEATTLETMESAPAPNPPLSPAVPKPSIPIGVKNMCGAALAAESPGGSAGPAPKEDVLPSSSTSNASAVWNGDEERLWDLLVQLRTDSNRLMERLLQKRHVKCAATDGSTPPDGARVVPRLQQTRQSRSRKYDEIRTRCDGQLTICTRDVTVFHQLQLLLPPTPLLSPPRTCLSLQTCGSSTRAGQAHTSGGHLRGWQTGNEDTLAAGRSFVWSRKDLSRHLSSSESFNSENKMQLRIVEDVDDLRWLLQFSHIELKLEADEIGSKHLDGEASDIPNGQVAVLPFEESCSKKIRLELSLAGGRRCSRCWMRSRLVGNSDAPHGANAAGDDLCPRCCAVVTRASR